MDTYAVLALLIGLPAIGAVLSLAIPHKGFRSVLVTLSSLLMIGGALYLTTLVLKSDGPLTVDASAPGIAAFGWLVKAIDFVVLAYVMVRGISAKRYLAPVLALIQLAVLVSFERAVHVPEPTAVFVIDHLALTLLLLASIIGPLILIFSIGYMEKHEAHLHLPTSRQPRFFAILFTFLAVMNGLAVADNLLWVYTFWEVTTLCSFLLISHDETEEAFRNAFRTLEMNMLGGVGFIIGIVLLFSSLNTVSLQDVTQIALKNGGFVGFLPLGIALLCFAGFTKSAQFPFQSWLLGAMVAPTPVSALLHSSTMVKAGVYLIVRMASVVSGSLLGGILAFAGAFTFVAASAIAISQRNGKRVLAYSTIANLGLIVCCAGIGSHAAVGAAILLMIFHAVSKGLLFLCIGTIEQEIGSRDIEDMQGLLKKMPFTTFVAVIGMVSMLLPPFGVLMTKWLAIEAAVHYPMVLLLLVLGSAFTVVVWAKWIGIILTMSYKPKYRLEKLHPSMSVTLSVLLFSVLAASAAIGPIFMALVNPHLTQLRLGGGLWLNGLHSGLSLQNSDPALVGTMTVAPLFVIVLLLVFAVPMLLARTKPEKVKPPYFGGELANNDIRGIDFYGPGDKIEQIVVHNYYLSNNFGEERLTLWLNIVAIATICIMFGVVV